MNRDVHLNALTTFERRKEYGRPGWQPTLPSEPGVVHAIRRYGAIATLEQPEFLETPAEHQRAMCGAKVKAILPTPFSNRSADECNRCSEQVRHEREHGLTEPTSWDGNPWWRTPRHAGFDLPLRQTVNAHS